MKYCVDCGVPLPVESPASKLRCVACAKERHNMLRRESKRRIRSRTSDSIRKRKESHEKSSKGLSDIERLAKEAGLSYGQYVSRYGV